MDDDAEDVLLNPAGLPGNPAPTVVVGVLGAQMAFTDIPGLWWDTNRDGLLTDGDPPLDVNGGYDPVQALVLGARRPVGKRFAFAAALVLPFQRLLRLQTYEPQLPTYFLYANRAQRYELGFGAGYTVAAGVSVGAGVTTVSRARFRLDATLDATVSGASADAADAADVIGVALDAHAIELDLVPGFVPHLALQWDAGAAVPALRGLSVAASWRGEAGLPVDVDVDLQLDVGTEDTDDLGAILVPLLLQLELGLYDHYVPEQWVGGAAYTLLETATFSGEVRWTRWDRMPMSVARVVSSHIDGAAVDFGDDPVADSNGYDITMRSTVSPRVGLDLRLPGIDAGQRFGDLRFLLRGGFAYEPTPLESQTAATALLDADRAVFAAGVGVEHDDPFRRAERRRVRWDGYVQYHLLANGELARPEPSAPTPGYPVGGGSVPIGGHLVAAGLQWSLEY